MTRPLDRTITVLGSPSVGKSALMLRFTENQFANEYSPTIARTNYHDFQYNGQKFQLTIQDTAGLEAYSHIPAQYITNTAGYILVYSITDRSSFDTISNVYDRLYEANNRQIPIVLVGNKSDLLEKRIVEKSEGEQLAKKWNSTFIETSAKSGQSVRDVFIQCLNVIDPVLNKNPTRNPTVSKQPIQEPSTQKCIIC